MAPIDTLLKINNVTVPKIKAYKVQRNKLWTDAGRNMAGELKSTFIGIFPKILVEFAPMPVATLDTIVTLLDNPSFDVAYYDPKTQTIKTGTYYAGDFEVSLLKKIGEIYQPFTVNLIPFNKE